ncbi:unnamed protein product [Penicillium salamii]|nr:unnamed protein product [Penicillium salamii]CAG8405983.1 unnamed protein product [Penicillium salamii]
MSATTPLALTTTFSPPASCTTDTWYVEYLSGSYYFTTSIADPLEGWFFSQGPSDWSSCFPSGYKTTTDFYYSPGVCPSGYSIASATTLSIGTNAETRATCCPSSYTARSNNNLVWYTDNRCFSDNTDPSHIWTYSRGKSVTSRTTSATTDSTGTGSIARNTASVSGPSATSATTTSNASSSPSQGDSSRAWIAGPVIGAVVACALIALAMTWYNRRRWRQRSSMLTDTTPQPAHELAYQPSRHIAELYQEPKMYEAPSDPISHGPFELPVQKNR